METASKLPTHSDAGAVAVAPGPGAVLQALEEVLLSQPFRTSKQCRDLLQYIVRHSLGNDDAGLRERVVGAEVFGRPADYDTSEDPVVRMRASDVRKRLAQFYQTVPTDESGVVIELKPGAYRASFRWSVRAAVYSPSDVSPQPPIHTQETSSPRVGWAPLPEMVSAPASEGGASNRAERRRLPRWLRWALLVFVLLAGGGVGWRQYAARKATAQRRFWTPLSDSGRPVLLFVGSNVAYTLRPDLLERYQAEHGKAYTGPEFFPDLPKSGTIRTGDLLPQDHTFVTVGDLEASSQVISLLSRWSLPFLLRSGRDVSIGDLRSSPTVLIGGFNNRWTLETMEGLPFGFKDGNRIESLTNPAHGWSTPEGNREENTVDFALVSRVLHANTGGPVLAIGGIGSFGTQAAAEFVASESDMARLLKNAPAGWEGRNMQAVLRIKVVGYSPVAVEVVETAFW